MKTFSATVRDGAVRVPRDAQVQDGAKVVVAVVSSGRAGEATSYPPELEAEDVEFVRACRGRLADSV